MELNISKFLTQFFQEAREKLVNVQNQMVELEQNPRQPDRLVQIQRDMHTIKGSARMVGLKEVSSLAHRLEDVFSLLQGQGGTAVSPQVMDTLYAAVDALTAQVAAAEGNRPAPALEPVLARLQLILDNRGDAPPGGAEEQGKPAAGGEAKKKFKLDFSALKRAVQGKEAGAAKGEKKEKMEPLPAPPPGPAVAEETRSAEALPAAAPAHEAAPAAMLTQEKKYLKVESEKIETIINQLTDLLSKRYFFTGVQSTFHSLSSILDGFKAEWKDRKKDGGAGVASEDGMSQITAMLDVFQRTIFDFGHDFQVNLTVFESSLRDIFDSMLEIKLTPLSTIYSVYPRFVRDYAHKSGKKIRLFLRGGDIQLDKNVIEKINEPLIHLVRNACDHGIEEPPARVAAGKDETGTLIIEANKKGNRVEIAIRDDGRGLSRERIVAAAVRRGLVDAAKAAELEDADVWAFIFEPSFSTASSVSDISGRGIGMDIVNKVIHQLNGSVRIETHSGQGTAILLEFPISIFTNRVMLLTEGGRPYAIPSNLIRRIVQLRPGDIQFKHDYAVVVHEGEIYTVAKLSQVLGGARDWGRGGKPLTLILPKTTDKKIGIVVDSIQSESEVIIKELGPFLGKRRFVYGIVIGERGDLQIVLDMHDIVQSEEFTRKVKILRAPEAAGAGPKTILVVDDSLLVREMEKNVLESAGFHVVTAVNGLDGVNKAISHKFDLILGDIEMPEMDGFEMIEQIRRIEEYKLTPIIVLSTREREEDKIRGIKVGANAWLLKHNFEDREFLNVIRNFIG
jgi:chemotaxis protein histidine kinase CheA